MFKQYGGWGIASATKHKGDSLLASEPNLEFGGISHDKDYDNESGNAELYPEAAPCGEAYTLFAGVCFFQEILPTPAIAMGAEEHVEEAS